MFKTHILALIYGQNGSLLVYTGFEACTRRTWRKSERTHTCIPREMHASRLNVCYYEEEYNGKLLKKLHLFWYAFLFTTPIQTSQSSSPQVVYVTATLPYVLLITFIIKGLTMDGASIGIRYYMVPDWSKLLTFQVSCFLTTPRIAL